MRCRVTDPGFRSWKTAESGAAAGTSPGCPRGHSKASPAGSGAWSSSQIPAKESIPKNLLPAPWEKGEGGNPGICWAALPGSRFSRDYPSIHPWMCGIPTPPAQQIPGKGGISSLQRLRNPLPFPRCLSHTSPPPCPPEQHSHSRIFPGITERFGWEETFEIPEFRGQGCFPASLSHVFTPSGLNSCWEFKGIETHGAFPDPSSSSARFSGIPG